MKSTLCLLMALLCNVAWAQTTKPEAFLTVSDLDDSNISYPHALSDDQAALVFGKDVLTIAVEVTTPSSMSVRGALVCAADPAKPASTVSPTTYTAVGLHKDRRYTYITSPVDGQQYSSAGGVAVNNSTRYKLIYVLGNGDGYNICKIYKYENGTLTNVLNRGRDNNNESATWIQGFKKTETAFPGSNLYIGGGVTSDGNRDVFTGLVHSVQFFDGVLTDDEIKLIEYPETKAMKALTDAVTANTSMNVYALQRYLGLVQNAGTGLEGNGQIKCNFPASTSQESGNAYANLFDNNNTTFFHSGYNNSNGQTLGDAPHYLQVDLGRKVKSFRFYTKKRNNNNRPTKITIEGSNDAEVWQPVTIVEGIPTNFDDFYSAEITSATAYKHYRFTVNTTSTSSVFFTFSEFYVLPNTPKVAATFDAVRAYRAGATVATATALNEMYTWNTELSSSMPKAGKDYYFYADTKQSNNTYVARYLYNNNGALATSQQLAIDNKYAWTASQPADTEYFTFQNVGDNTKYLGYGNSGNGLTVNTTAVQLDIKPSYAVHAGSVGVQRIGNDSNGKWMVTKADGTSFNRNGSKSNDGSWCSDYVFVPADLYEGVSSFTVSGSADATATFNGETKALPAIFYLTEAVADENATVVITSNDPTRTPGTFTDGSSTIETLKVTSLTGHKNYTVNFNLNLEDGGRYYLYAYTQPTSGNYVNRYLYKNPSGNVATSADLVDLFDNYIWTVTKDGTGYKLTNAAGGKLRYNSTNRFYLDNNTGDVFGVDPTNVATQGKVSIVANTNLYVSTSANGQSFNHFTNGRANSTSWTTDYMFVPVDEPENEYVINFVTNSSSAANATVTINGETKALPATFNIAKTTANAEVTITVGNADYTFAGLYEYGSSTDLGATYTFAPQGHKLFTVEYSFNLISENFADAVPVQIYNDEKNAYGIKLNAAADYVGKAVNSGTIAHKENEQWYLVGSESNFKMYSRTAGEAYAVKVAGTVGGSAATMVAVADATPLQLKAMEDGSYRIAPASSANANVSFNMHGGPGADIKLFDGSGSEWRFRRMPKNPLLTVNVVVEGEQPLPTNTRVAELSYNNALGTHIITKDTESLVMYVPFGDVALTQPWLYRGYTFEGFYVGEATTPTDFNGVTLTDEGLTITAKYSIDEDNDYQYLYWYRSEDINAPYRIPAITVTKSGKVLAISDYRPCGDDIGMGEVDIMFRRSTESYDNWDKKSWTEMDYVADGQGGNENVFNVGFGDAAVVSDRESNKTLVMAVAGKQRFNWASATSHNSVARIVTENDGDTWEISDLTNQFFGDENVLFPGFYAGFITSGRILQSSTYKAPGAQYYRIYGVAATNDDGNGSYPNYVLYSDDFGATWKMLGGSLERGMCCDAGNETTIEELPNGDLVVSVRRGGGRYFNIFNYGNGENDKANGIGEWEIKAGDTKVTSNFGAADCNGEMIRVGNVLLHSHPEGGVPNKARSNVAIYYKVIDPEKDYTASEIATGWAELTQVSTMGSAYSVMALLPDGKTVGFLYEEDPDDGTFAYCIVYKPIDLTKLLTAEAQKEAFVVNSTIGQYEIGTFYANDAMVVPEGVTAYVATAEPEMDGEDAQGNATGAITMTKVEDGIIPAQTGALICGKPGTYSFKLADTEGETDVTKNLMPGYAGIYEHKDVALANGYNTYVLTVKGGAAGFYRKEADFKVYNNKAYLQVPAAVSANALRIRLAGTTGIENVETTDNGQQSTAIYDLQGRRVANPTKGIYIVNGKKVVIK